MILRNFIVKRVSAATLIFALALALLTVSNPSTAKAFSGDGSGTSGSPYRIETCAQLQDIANGLTAYYILVANVDCNGYSFTPIGTYNSAPFTGTLDGQGFTISNLTTSFDDFAGLFAYTSGATLKSLNFTGLNVNSTGNSAGGLVAWATSTTITDISVAGAVQSASWTGGVVGITHGTTSVTKTHFNGTVIGGPGYTNGIIAVMYDTSTLSDSYSEGTITSSASGYSGGLVGNIVNNGTVTRSYSTMTINQDGSYLGGLVGTMGVVPGSAPTFTNSFFAGNVVSTSGELGGVLGLNAGGTMSGNYYDTTACPTCTNGATGYGDDTGGTAVSGSANFKTDNSHAPLTTWNFTTVWQAVSGNFPVLRTVTAPTAPSAPTSFSATKTGANVALSWSAPSTAGGGSRSDYQLQYKASTDSGWTTYSHTASASLSSAQLTGLTPGKTYSFRVRAINSTVNGSWSTLTNNLTINGGIASGLSSGLSLKNNSDSSDLTTSDAGGSVTAQLALSSTGQVLSTFTFDLTANRDVSGISGSTDTTTGATVIGGIGSVSGVGATHTLYVPKLTGQTNVRICPNATSLTDVTTTCSGGTTYSEGDSGVSVVTVGSKTYWVVSGLTGTGGVGMTVAATASTSPSPSPSLSPTPSPSTTTTAATLADTGSDVFLPTLFALLLILGSGVTLVALRRHAQISQK